MKVISISIAVVCVFLVCSLPSISAQKLTNGLASLPLFSKENELDAIVRMVSDSDIFDAIMCANVHKTLYNLLFAITTGDDEMICFTAVAHHINLSKNGKVGLYRVQPFMNCLANYILTCLCGCGPTAKQLEEVYIDYCEGLDRCDYEVFLNMMRGGPIDPLAVASSYTSIVRRQSQMFGIDDCVALLGLVFCSHAGLIVKPEGIADYTY